MTDREINYNLLVEKALMEVVRESLRHVGKYGLNGQQHFYITFRTNHPGVILPPHLRERYEDEMTVVLQHQFWDLTVDEEKFSVGLSFNHQREFLEIPFAAFTAFADPSVQFGLQFNIAASELDEEEAEADVDIESSPSELIVKDTDKKEDETPKQGEVIALDAFRNK